MLVLFHGVCGAVSHGDGDVDAVGMVSRPSSRCFVSMKSAMRLYCTNQRHVTCRGKAHKVGSNFLRHLTSSLLAHICWTAQQPTAPRELQQLLQQLRHCAEGNNSALQQAFARSAGHTAAMAAARYNAARFSSEVPARYQRRVAGMHAATHYRYCHDNAKALEV